MVRFEDTKDALGSMLRRIDQRLKRMQLTDRGASIAAGLSPDQIRSMRRQYKAGTQHGASTRTIAQLAVALRTSPEWLMSGTGPEEREPAGLDAPYIDATAYHEHQIGPAPAGLGVAGVVAAGQWLEPGVSAVETQRTRYPPIRVIPRTFSEHMRCTAMPSIASPAQATFSSWSTAKPPA